MLVWCGTEVLSTIDKQRPAKYYWQIVFGSFFFSSIFSSVRLCKALSMFQCHWFLSKNFRLPYDWHSPLGYALAVAYQMITFLGVLVIFVTCLAIYFGICKFAITFADDFVAEFNKISHQIANCHGNFSPQDHTTLNRQLTVIMEFQENAIRLGSIQFWYSIVIYSTTKILFVFSALWRSSQNYIRNSFRWFFSWWQCICVCFSYAFKW